MPAKTNPFPGMNPYLQESWSDVHTMLIGYIRDALSEELPADLSARAEERVTLEGGKEDGRSYRTDVGVVEPWRAGFPPLMTSFGDADQGGTLAVAEPLMFMVEFAPERWIEVLDAGGRLITVIEVLSPANKSAAGMESYRERQRHFLAGGINLVEIDLLRGGSHAVAIEREKLALPPGTCHVVCVTRRMPPGEGFARREVYPCPLREPLPTIRVPLRRRDPDVQLALQPLVNRCYRTGRYWLTVDPRREMRPPAADESEAAWIAERMQVAEGR